MQGRKSGTGIVVVIAALGLGALAWWLLGEWESESGDNALTPQAVTPADASGVDAKHMVGFAARLTVDAERIEAEPEPEPTDDADVTALGASTDLPIRGPVHGVVVDAEQRPLPDATVRWIVAKNLREPGWQEDDDWVAHAPATRSDEHGAFSLSGPHRPQQLERFNWWADVYPMLLVTAPGFAAQPVGLQGLERGPFDVGQVVLSVAASLEGRCVDIEGRPLEGANVWALPSDPHWQATFEDGEGMALLLRAWGKRTTGPDGSFLFDDLHAAFTGLKASMPGRVDSSRVFQLEAGQVTDAGEQYLILGESLHGRVFDGAGAPVAQAAVFVRSWQAFMIDGLGNADDVLASEMAAVRSPVAEPDALTDEQGRFTVTGLKPANSRLYVEARGYEWGRLTDVGPGPDELTVVLEPHAVAELLVVDVRDGSAVRGAEVSGTRRRYADARMPDGDRALRVSPLTVAASETVPAGRFVAERVGLVRTDIMVSAPGFATRGFQLRGAVPGTVLQRTLTLQPEGVLAGRVLDGQGVPLPEATVTCEWLPSARVSLPLITVQTDTEGRFEAGGLQPGEWNVMADSPNHLPAGEDVHVPRDDGSAEVAEALAALRELEFTLVDAGTIKGLLLDVDGAIRPRELLYSWRMAEAEDPWVGLTEKDVSVFTDSEGRFRMQDLAPGRWSVGGIEDVDLPEGGSIDVVLRPRPPTLALITGVVSDDRGPVAAARVSADRLIEGVNWWVPLGRAVTDEQGRYSLELKRSTHVRLSAQVTEVGCVPAPPVDLEVVVGQSYVQDLRLPGGRVSGRVTAGVGGPALRGALVLLQPFGGEEPQTLSVETIGADGQTRESWPRTDELGRFELRHVGTGRHRLIVQHGDFRTEVIDPVMVAEGGSNSLDVALEPGARLIVMALLPGEVPVEDGTQVLLMPEVPYDRVSFGIHSSSANPGLAEKLLSNTTLPWPTKLLTSSGRASFGKLRAGAWTVQVAVQHGSPDEQPLVILGEQRIVLSPGEERRLDMLAKP